MLNFVPKRCPSVSLLYGKRAIQRIEVGSRKHHVEIPVQIVDDVCKKVDTSVEYKNKGFNPLPWSEFIKIKLDAQNLMESNVKSALTDLDWYPKLAALHVGHSTLTEIDAAAKVAAPSAPVSYKLPVSG
uniref:Uncharacterized protein n=1 Tax=Chromera velia CCMP2878 TaxID=1169474 RepID=A0A0G4FV77_9ALVE|mmetsp:Transcript_9958/g.19319  ORF Transcript_9958/g.19319 Transcript_9958/m.19319 type:complete len:129 (-) Transcript_9958:389-775(-)|eukprot:Cvel_18921.t1-p1 / transcript=Cvel_18921.t1 / gene=Cvel_18921 / organism=Chromera_velia_CCMP2878 / gene_product=hypothetical protein / transcript_product=hypothetical protein / location=Cvel_scaffold1595:32832-35074(+) / protein_length=128 / sequence_SO=supercontig / SO=protein_coding / is_pseudo=false